VSDSQAPALPPSPPLQASRDLALDPLADAMLRLQRSRACLRSAMMPAPPRIHHARGAGATSRLMSWLTSGSIGQAVEPLFGGARLLLLRWWSRHPWHSPVMMAKEAVQGEVTPLLRRHPVTSVVVAAALGAGLVASGVLHGGLVRGSLAGARRLARRWFIVQLSSPAMQTVVIGAITTLLASQLRAKTLRP
jgi:hypothetical protein